MAIPTGIRIINNLYYFGMDETNTPLVQAYVNQKTFQTSPTDNEDAYEVIKKVNRAWLQTMFQYRGKWWFFRMEEPLNNPTNFRGIIWSPLAPGGNGTINTRWDYNIGINENIKPIQPQPLKTINRQTNYDKINIKYKLFESIIINQQFLEGEFETSLTSPYREIYSIYNWEVRECVQINFVYPGTLITPSYPNFKRVLEFDNGTPKDEYVQIGNSPLAPTLLYMAASTPFYAQEGQEITLSFDYMGGSGACAVLFLVGYNGNKYFMTDQGAWGLYNPLSSVDRRLHIYPQSTDVWESWQISRTIKDSNNNDVLTNRSIPIPTDGDLILYLYTNNATVQSKYKNIEITMEFPFTNSRKVIGNYSKYTQSNSLKNFEDEIYFDDMLNGQYKGAIFYNGELTLANKWYRYQWEPETLGFKQANAIGQYLLHRRYRMKLDGKFFGLNGTTNTIGLHHTFIFVDDLPTKQFMILNLNEIDFNAATWSATLIETYDTDIDDANPSTYDEYKTAFIY